MQVKIYLNELSLNSWKLSLHDAKKCTGNFIYTVLNLIKNGAEKSLPHPQGLLTLQLTKDFKLVQWLNDPSNDKDLITFAKSVLTKSPYFENVDDIKRYELDVKYNAQDTQGLLYAYINDGIAVSFLSSDEWDSSILKVDISSLNEHGDISEMQRRIKHVSKSEHIKKYCDFIQSAVEEKIVDGGSLIQNYKATFPEIIFCDSTIKQIEDISGNDPHLKQLLRVLTALSDYISTWNGGVFDMKNINCDISTESQTTLKKYSDERTFVCPDGIERVFNIHMKINPNAWRVYIHPVHESREIIVGYVGKHLNTVNNKQN